MCAVHDHCFVVVFVLGDFCLFCFYVWTFACFVLIFLLGLFALGICFVLFFCILGIV